MAAHSPSDMPGSARVALVIGNAAYRCGPKLSNPITDSDSIAGAFERLGFASVTRESDLDKAGQDRALKSFTAAAKTADVAVVYYAGHGMEMDGENYLLPVDAELTDVLSLGFEATRLSDVMRAVEGARHFRFVILDACRDNPFRGRMQGLESTRSIATRGLAPVEPPGNTLVAYAARHGTTAKDGAKGKNSPYAAALLSRLETPNLDIRLVLGHVRDDVVAATDNQQHPFFYGTLGGAEIALKRVAAPTPRALVAGEQAELLRTLEEERDWERALRTNSVQGFESFRAAWPGGRFAELVSGKIDEVLHALEQVDWDKAERSGSSAAFQSFQRAWPKGNTWPRQRPSLKRRWAAKAPRPSSR